SFKKMITEMKESWKMEDAQTEKEIAELEKTITHLEKNVDADMRKLDNMMNSQKEKELEKAKVQYEEEIKSIDKDEKSFVSKFEKDIADGMAKIAKMTKEIEEIDKKNKDLDKVKEEIDANYLKEQQAKGAEIDKIRMANEDEDRKYYVEVSAEYQVKFDGFNSKLEVWEKREVEKIAIVDAVDKEIENYSVAMANKLGDFQSDIEKRREELAKKFKDEELEAKSMELDMELAKKSEEMNKELGEYRKQKLEEKKQKEFELDKFRMEKHDFKKQNDAQISSAAKIRDNKIDMRKNQRKRAEETWDREKKSMDARYKSLLDLKFTKPLDQLLKKRSAIERDAIKVNDKIAEDRGKSRRDRDAFERSIQERRANNEEIYRAQREGISSRYDGQLLMMKQKEEKKKNDLESRRTQLIEKREKNREKRQTLLNKKKEQYEKEKAKCK
ncbi:MAG TPA: hypothetical protein VLJ60_04505, partial [bacterium]|nr:hypothetical protein [bacterium]